MPLDPLKRRQANARESRKVGLAPTEERPRRPYLRPCRRPTARKAKSRSAREEIRAQRLVRRWPQAADSNLRFASGKLINPRDVALDELLVPRRHPQ